MEKKLEIIFPVVCFILSLLFVWLSPTLSMFTVGDRKGITVISILVTLVILGKRNMEDDDLPLAVAKFIGAAIFAGIIFSICSNI